MKHVIAKVCENRHVVPDFYRMRIAAPSFAKTARPGQFLTVRCEDDSDPLLRRPFGIHRIFPGGIEILYEVVGKGTASISKKRPGETIDILGPLGNGFDTRPLAKKKARAIIIAGGIGIAPLAALAEACVRKGAPSPLLLIGARKASHVLAEKELKRAGCEIVVSTDDGSRGTRGLVTDTLRRYLQTAPSGEKAVLYACGPTPMLKAVWEIAGPKGIACQFSFEEHMACGVGVCLGCPIKVRCAKAEFEYKMICKDGPVFNGSAIVW